MALSKSLEFTPAGLSTQITVNNVYFRIEDIKGNKKALKVKVCGYETADSTTPLAIMDYVIKPVLASNNIYEEIYVYLKTLPEFEGAEDC